MWLLACAEPEGGDVLHAGRGADTDTDADTDADADADADTDTDTDTDTAACAAWGARGRCSVADPPDQTDVLEPGIDFDALVPSWNADTPAGAWVEVEAQVRVGGEWTAWYHFGVWAAGSSGVERHSTDGQSDAHGEVWTDTLFLDRPASAARLRVSRHGGATVTRLAVAVANTANQNGDDGGDAWGRLTDPPDRSQMEFAEGEAWCSPTTVSMMLGYFADQLGNPAVDSSVPTAADQTWDSVYQGNGNWPFNTAFMATRGLTTEVGWFGSVSELEPWIAAGFPVAVSAAWGRGELDDAPVSSTAGHLLLVTGFDDEGNVHVNDPAAASDEEVPRLYDREQFASAWLGGSGGVVYLAWTGARPD